MLESQNPRSERRRRTEDAMSQRLPGVLLGIGAIVLCFGLRAGGLFEGLELVMHDRFLRAELPAAGSESPVVAVAIGENEFERYGYPIPDAVLARALSRLAEAGTVAIGIDLYRDGPADTDAAALAGWMALRDVVEANPSIVVSELLSSPDQRGIPAPDFASASQVGFNNLLMDPGRVVRRGYLFAWDDEGQSHSSLSLQLALRFLARQGVGLAPAAEDADWIQLGPTTIPPLEDDYGAYAALDSGGYQFPLDYTRAPEAITKLRFAQLVEGSVAPASLEGRVAILGTDAPSVKDDFNAPHVVEGAVKGYRIHAQVTDQLIRMGDGTATPRRDLSEFAESGWVLGWGIAGVSLAFLLGSLGWAIPCFGLGWAVLYVSAGAAYSAGVWIPVVAPAFAWAVAGGVSVGDRARREARDQHQLMSMFRRFNSRRVADWLWSQRDEIMEGGRARARRVTITALLSDLKGYTAAAEKMEPAELMAWIDSYMEAMTEVIERYDKGHVDDYVGDGIKANFGVPIPSETPEEIAVDAKAAVLCALDMGRTLERLNKDWAARGWPTGRQRIGLFTGEAVVGSIGGDERQKYTSVGDTINTAARLEGIGGALDFDQESALQRILIGERTRALIGDDFDVVDEGAHSVKGKTEPLRIYRVVGERASAHSAPKEEQS